MGKIPWSRTWQPTPVFLPKESHGQRGLAGYTVHGVEKNQTQLKWLSTAYIWPFHMLELFSGLTFTLYHLSPPQECALHYKGDYVCLFQHILTYCQTIFLLERRNKWMCLGLICIYMTNTCIYRSHHLVSYLSLRERYYGTIFFLVVIATHWPPELQVNSDALIFPEVQQYFQLWDNDAIINHISHTKRGHCGVFTLSFLKMAEN